MAEDKVFSIRSLVESEDNYFIPIYQRNYAWDFPQVYQLIEDIADYCVREKGKAPKTKYYIGSLVVLQDKGNPHLFETIDGQQRLTTLYIMLSSYANLKGLDFDFSKLNRAFLEFRNRKKSENAMKYISEQYTSVKREDCESNILSVFDAVGIKTQAICCERAITMEEFLAYLLDYVHILRINVPEDVDKNHYFEIMNSRGVQLEQHEIVKARLMGFLDSNSERTAFNTIWRSCSYMEKYVQMNFTDVKLREKIFGTEWENDPTEDFKEVLNHFSDESGGEAPITLAKIIEEYDPKKVSDDKHDPIKDGEEQFYSVINFPNFLLHTLKVLAPVDKSGNKMRITLDDKVLSKSFDDVLNEQNDKHQFVVDYVMCLLRCRYLFDKYIVRHMYSKDPEKWCLLKLKTRVEDKHRQPYYVNVFGEEQSGSDSAIMLLSMFHVSVPAMIYKNWLYAALSFAYKTNDFSAEQYSSFLFNLAMNYMLDRYLARDGAKNEISFIVDRIAEDFMSKPQNIGEPVDWNNLNRGTAVEVFVFNFYDYLLWLEKGKPVFSFTHRNSVEHFFPQHPINVEPMDDGPLNNFGNLCLITSSQNSKFTNLMPVAKYAQYQNDDTVIKQSLKLHSMFDAVGNGTTWDERVISDAFIDAKRIFEQYLSII